MKKANRERAKRFDQVLEFYGTLGGDAECPQDILADFKHWCDSKNLSAADIDRIAYGHYLEERYERTRASSPSPSVIRFVVTHVNKDGDRVLAHAQQGRYTFAQEAEAQSWIDAARANTMSSLRSVYPNPDSLEVRPCECWPVHFDPKGCYFD